MAVQPPRGPQQGAAYRNRTTEAAVSKAEKEAQQRIALARSRVDEAEKQSAQSLDQLRDEYSHQYENQWAHQEESIEALKTKGYEHLKDLKRSQEKELNQIKREGESQIAKLSDYYRDNTYKTEKQGQLQLDQVRFDSGRALEYEKKSSDYQIDFAKDQHTRNLETIKNAQEETVASISEAARKQIEDQRIKTTSSMELSEQKLQERLEALRTKHTDTIGKLYQKTNEDISNIRFGTSNKLSAYESRQEDPFYKMVDIQAKLEESDDAYILTAQIPRHEQSHVGVSIRGDQLVLSGKRRNEEKLEVQPGSEITTSSFQSYSKTFSIPFPVDSKMLQRRFDGDTFIVTIPKKSTYSAQPFKTKKIERTQAVRPKFPGNLPITPSGDKGAGTLS